MISLSHFQDKTIAVFGLGKSGIAAALALKAGGAEVWAWDDLAETRAQPRDPRHVSFTLLGYPTLPSNVTLSSFLASMANSIGSS